MKLNIIAFLLVALVLQASADYTCTTESYNQFRLDFEKKEDLSPEQYQAKFAKFCWSLQNVQALNSQSPHTTFSINQFSDFLEEDNKSIL